MDDAGTGLPLVERALVEHFGSAPLRASISFVGVEPIDILRFEPIPDERAYVSLGMSRRPMTGADAAVVSADGPRAELMLHLRDPRDEHAELWRKLAVLAAAPAVEGVVYVEEMTVEIGEPLSAGSRCVGALITASSLAAIATPTGSVQILQAVPATSVELAWARVHGTPALQERWQQEDTDLLDLRRAPVSLR